MKAKNKNHTAIKPPKCPYCGEIAILKRARDIYGKDTKWIADEYVYVCKSYPQCDSYVSTKRGTKIPRGSLANADLRNLRIRTHKVFDQVWKNGIMSKPEAYRWLGYTFGLNKEQAHIGLFSEYLCSELIRICEQVLENNNIPKVS